MRTVGINYNGGKLRSFFDGYGDLRFCTEDDVLIDPSSDPRLEELIEFSNNLPADHELFSVFQSFTGTLDELHQAVVGSYHLAPVLEMKRRTASDLVELFLSGVPASEVIEDVMNPQKQRFAGSDAVNPQTGKPKDPAQRASARAAARHGSSSRAAAQRKFTRSSRGKRFYKKLGRFNSRHGQRDR